MDIEMKNNRCKFCGLSKAEAKGRGGCWVKGYGNHKWKWSHEKVKKA